MFFIYERTKAVMYKNFPCTRMILSSKLLLTCMTTRHENFPKDAKMDIGDVIICQNMLCCLTLLYYYSNTVYHYTLHWKRFIIQNMSSKFTQNYKNYFFHYNAQILGSADFRGQGWEMRPRFSTKYNGVPQSEGWLIFLFSIYLVWGFNSCFT